MIDILILFSLLTGALSFVHGFNSHGAKGGIEKYAQLGYVFWCVWLLTFHFIPLQVIVIICLVTIFNLGTFMSQLGLDTYLFHLNHPDVPYVRWRDLKTDEIANFMGDGNISGKKVSTIDDIIIYVLTFTHPVNKGWSYNTFESVIICLEGEVIFSFKNGRDIILVKDDSMRIHKKELHKITTKTNSKIRVGCIK